MKSLKFICKVFLPVLLYLVSAFMLTSCNVGGNVSGASATAEPQLSNNYVHFYMGAGVENISATLESYVIESYTGHAFKTQTKYPLFSIDFENSYSLPSDSIAMQYIDEIGNAGAMTAHSIIGRTPSHLYFYITTDFYINGKPIIGSGKQPPYFYIGEGKNWIGQHSWWVR